MTDLLRRLVRDESGQDIIEYALIAAGVAVVAVPSLPAIGTLLTALYQGVLGKVQEIPVP